VFFTLAPNAIVMFAALFPMTGALLSIGMILTVFLFAEAIRARLTARSWVPRPLARALKLEAYYRAHPPRPFLYYVFYPLLFPYWLWSREARQEFILFKGFTLGGIAILLATATHQYFSAWWPDLSLSDYLPVLGMTFGVECLLVLALLMPMATTVVGFHSTMRRGRLVALLAIGLLSTGLAIARLARRRESLVSYATRERVELRTSAYQGRAREAQRAGIIAAFASLAKARGAVGQGGRVEGEPLDAAREALESFYKPDESNAFGLWASARRDPDIVMLYFPERRSRSPIWLARRRDGVEITDAKQLPPEALAAMRIAIK
jgi:hypothetical protein